MTESRLHTFTEHGYKLGGVIHVGANDGAEIEWYQKNGVKPILCFDPNAAAIARARATFGLTPDVTFVQVALGAQDESLNFHLPQDGDDEKFSRYTPIPTPGHDWTFVPDGTTQLVPVIRFDHWLRAFRHTVDMQRFFTLAIDAQGMELEVLIGFGAALDWIDFLCVEMSARPVYTGEASAEAVVEFLTIKGFTRITDIREHEDVLFQRASGGRLTMNGGL